MPDRDLSDPIASGPPPKTTGPARTPLADSTASDPTAPDPTAPADALPNATPSAPSAVNSSLQDPNPTGRSLADSAAADRPLTDPTVPGPTSPDPVTSAGSAFVAAENDAHVATLQATSWKAVGCYCLIAFALAWLVCLPLWLGDGLESPYFMIAASVMMFTPTIAGLVAVKFVEKAPLASGLDLKPRRGAGRMVGFMALAVVVMIALCFLGLVSSHLLGTYRIDPQIGAFRSVLEQQLQSQGKSIDDLPVSIWVLWAVQFVNIVIASLLNTITAAGEEIGWRGYLFPRLRELTGPLVALILCGVIWGLWHAPLILLGYNYPSNPVLGTFVMIIPCIGLTAIFVWFAEQGGAVWPAAVAHGAFNAAVSGSFIMLSYADEEPNTFAASLMGWGGWPVFAIIIVVLLATGGLRRWQPVTRSVASTPAAQGQATAA